MKDENDVDQSMNHYSTQAFIRITDNVLPDSFSNQDVQSNIPMQKGGSWTQVLKSKLHTYMKKNTARQAIQAVIVQIDICKRRD